MIRSRSTFIRESFTEKGLHVLALPAPTVIILQLVGAGQEVEEDIICNLHSQGLDL